MTRYQATTVPSKRTKRRFIRELVADASAPRDIKGRALDPTWTVADLAYFAGLLDGEGSFCLKNNGSHRFSCQIQIGSTDIRVLTWVRDRFSGSVNLERRNNPRHKPMWRWCSSASTIDAILAGVLPYLITKREQAEVMIAYRSTLGPLVKEKRSTYDTPDWAKHERFRLHEQLAKLNKRGAAQAS